VLVLGGLADEPPAAVGEGDLQRGWPSCPAHGG
jgi:hypothetical protein